MNFDVGIMPLDDSPWSKGKCAYKLIQYMACKLPVIASPVGANKEVVAHGINGYLAATGSSMVGMHRRLHQNPSKREEHGKKGFEKVQKSNLDQATKRWLGVLKKFQNHRPSMLLDIFIITTIFIAGFEIKFFSKAIGCQRPKGFEPPLAIPRSNFTNFYSLCKPKWRGCFGLLV